MGKISHIFLQKLLLVICNLYETIIYRFINDFLLIFSLFFDNLYN
jgi:hypothetical protein